MAVPGSVRHGATATAAWETSKSYAPGIPELVIQRHDPALLKACMMGRLRWPGALRGHQEASCTKTGGGGGLPERPLSRGMEGPARRRASERAPTEGTACDMAWSAKELGRTRETRGSEGAAARVRAEWGWGWAWTLRAHRGDPSHWVTGRVGRGQGGEIPLGQGNRGRESEDHGTEHCGRSWALARMDIGPR